MNVILTSLALCTIIASVSGQMIWCYHSDTCDPPTWPTLFPDFCNRSRQSPINIDTALAKNDVNLTEFNFTMYDSKNLSFLLNGGTLLVAFVDTGIQISGGGLSEPYDGLDVYFHWGNGTTTPGSEHTVDGKRYPMEMQIFHTKSSLKGTSAEFLKNSEGIAVLAFFIEALPDDETESPEVWKKFTSYFNQITGHYEGVEITIPLDDLLGSVDRTQYYRYLGSLTTPNCAEAVVWTVFKDPIKISRDLIDKFGTTLRGSNSYYIGNNFRNIQPNQEVTKRETRINSNSSSSNSSKKLVPTSFFGLVTLILVQLWARQKQ